jgi:hypothetical protein
MRELCIIPCGKRKIWDKFTEKAPTEVKNPFNISVSIMVAFSNITQLSYLLIKV